MMISVQRKSLLNLNISPFVFRREMLLEELAESRTRDNTLRFNNLQFTNHNIYYTSIVRHFRKNRTSTQVFLWLRRLLKGVVSNKQAISVRIWRSVRDVKCQRACNSGRNVFRCVHASVSRSGIMRLNLNRGWMFFGSALFREGR